MPATTLLLRGRVRSLDDRAMPIPERELQILRSVDLFASLPAPELEGLAARMTEVTAASGTAVVREGESGRHFYVIVDGEVEVIRADQPVAALCAGDYFGEIALLRDVPRTATVVAKTRTKLLSIEREGFLEEVTGHPVIRNALDVTAQERTPDE